jgi:hypothetical protein
MLKPMRIVATVRSWSVSPAADGNARAMSPGQRHQGADESEYDAAHQPERKEAKDGAADDVHARGS